MPFKTKDFEGFQNKILKMKRGIMLLVVCLVVVVGVGGIFGEGESEESKWTENQWKIDEDDNPENGITPAKDKTENWPSSNLNQIQSLSPDKIAEAPKGIRDQISNKMSSEQWDAHLQKNHNGLRAGEGGIEGTEGGGLEGATQNGDIITKNGASVNLKGEDGGGFESDSKIDFVSRNGETYAVVRNPNGDLVSVNRGVSIRPAQPRLQSPGIQQPGIGGSLGGGSGGGSSGGGGGAGGQDPGSMLQQGMQIAQQMAGLLEGLKGSAGSNGQGSTQATALAGGGAEFRLNNGAEVYVDNGGENQVKLAQSDEDEEAVVEVDDGLDSLLAESNVEASVYNQVTISTSSSTPPTEILLAGIAGDSPVQEAEALALNQEYYSVSGAVIRDLSGRQFVKLIEHSLSLSGNKIIVDLFKSFNSIEGDGEELWVRNGEMNIKFQGIKIYYSRKIGNVDNSVGSIANLQDRERVFSLIEYRDSRARLIDFDKRISIGDMSIEHPRESGLQIAKVREGMWVER